jgi:hypothetical protein
LLYVKGTDVVGRLKSTGCLPPACRHNFVITSDDHLASRLGRYPERVRIQQRDRKTIENLAVNDSAICINPEDMVDLRRSGDDVT